MPTTCSPYRFLSPYGQLFVIRLNRQLGYQSQ